MNIYIHIHTYINRHTHIYMYVYTIYIYIYALFTNISAWAGYDTRSISKRSLTGLNSEFSFSKSNCLIKADKPVCPTIYP